MRDTGNPLSNPQLTVVTVRNVPKDPPRYTISGVNVVVRRDGQQVASGTTDQNGRVTFSNLASGTYQITASKDGYRSGSTTVNFPQQTEVYVELVAIGLELQVEVVDSQKRAPIRGATVTVKKGDRTVTSGTTNENGIATFKLDSDEYIIEVQAQGYDTGSASVVLTQNQQKVQVALRPLPQDGYRLEVIVVDYKRRAISAATVTVFRDGQRVDSKVTGADGKVTFRLERGAYTVEASKSGYKSGDRININLDGDRTEQLTLRGYVLTVRVLDSSTKRPISGATVKVYDQHGNLVDESTTK